MTGESPRSKNRYLLPLVFTAGMIAIAASIRLVFGAEVSTYSKGAIVYAEFGCGACHESLVLGPIQRRRKPAPHVFEEWIDTSDLSEEIRFGSYESDDYAIAQRSVPRKIKMPAYNDLISKSDLRALLVFLQVNQLMNMHSTSAGQSLAKKYGCFDCHGPLGLGGVVNPRSFKGYIPGWFGLDFDELTNNGNREVIAEWINDGTSSSITGKSFGRGMVARHFGESPAIKMPAFNRRIPMEDLNILVDYVLSLRSLGDMSLSETQQYWTLYTSDTESPNTQPPE